MRAVVSRRNIAFCWIVRFATVLTDFVNSLICPPYLPSTIGQRQSSRSNTRLQASHITA